MLGPVVGGGGLSCCGFEMSLCCLKVATCQDELPRRLVSTESGSATCASRTPDVRPASPLMPGTLPDSHKSERTSCIVANPAIKENGG